LQNLLKLVKDLHKSVTWGIKDLGPNKKKPLRDFAKERLEKKEMLEKERQDRDNAKLEKELNKLKSIH
jgi:hypothetical protein